MKRLLDYILPHYCLLCGDPGIERMAICQGCFDALPINRHGCVRCAERLPDTAVGLPALRVCGHCLWHPPPYAAIHVPFRYEPPLDWLVAQLKFRGDLAAGRLLGDLLRYCLASALPQATAIVPIPLHPARLRSRGFNQAHEIARPLGMALGIPIRTDVLARAGSRTPQMELPARTRRDNIRNAFRATQPAPPGRILLVDDVVTTASTAREATRSLGSTERTEVHVAALARA